MRAAALLNLGTSCLCYPALCAGTHWPPPQVKLPHTLQDQLEQTTAFKSRIAEVAKKHENTIRVLTDEAAQAALSFMLPSRHRA